MLSKPRLGGHQSHLVVVKAKRYFDHQPKRVSVCPNCRKAMGISKGGRQ